MTLKYGRLYGNPQFVTDGYKGSLCWDVSTSVVHSYVVTNEDMWLRVDLGGMKQIKAVDIYNRIIGSPHHQRLAFIDIIVFGQNPSDNRQYCSTVTIKDVESYEIFKVCDQVLTGSGVELYKASRGVWHFIHICEMAVYRPVN